MILAALASVDSMRSHNAWLRERSPYFPDFLSGQGPNGDHYFSTLVRIQRDGVWYTVHCVERYRDFGDTKDIRTLCLERLVSHAYMVQKLFKLTGDPMFEQIDKFQISEEDRLSLEIPHR